MENQITVQNNIPQRFIELNSKEEQITGIIYHVNQLTSFPLSKTQIEDWSITINDFYPDLDLEILKDTIRKYKLGKLKWDSRQGVQNICEVFTALHIEDRYSKEDSKRSEEEYQRMMNPRQPIR